MNDEIWRTLEEDPRFEISNHGSIRNRETKTSKTPYMNRGKLRITLASGRYYVHRLVMKYFGSQNANGRDGRYIRHLDDNAYNNRIDNLAYCVDSVPYNKKRLNRITVVRCGDCIHYMRHPQCMTHLPEWYCADGEKA